PARMAGSIFRSRGLVRLLRRLVGKEHDAQLLFEGLEAADLIVGQVRKAGSRLDGEHERAYLVLELAQPLELLGAELSVTNVRVFHGGILLRHVLDNPRYSSTGTAFLIGD